MIIFINVYDLFYNSINLKFFIMKKSVFNLFVVLCLIFVACDTQTGSGDNEYSVPEGAVGLQALVSEYKTGADMGYSSATHSFLLMFATEDCEVIDGTAFGTGGVLVFELCSETADGLLPAEGIYRIEDMAPIEDGMIIGGFDVGMGLPFGTYRHNMVDGEFVDWDLITGGAVEIRQGKAADELEFYIYVVFEDGSEENYYYGGKLLVSDLSSSAE